MFRKLLRSKLGLIRLLLVCVRPSFGLKAPWTGNTEGEMLIKFLAKDFMASIELYTEAIHLNPKDSTLWNNRAMSKGKMEEFGGAISDASELFSSSSARFFSNLICLSPRETSGIGLDLN